MTPINNLNLLHNLTGDEGIYDQICVFVKLINWATEHQE
jgi:hypothetical protein